MFMIMIDDRRHCDEGLTLHEIKYGLDAILVVHECFQTFDALMSDVYTFWAWPAMLETQKMTKSLKMWCTRFQKDEEITK